MYTVKALESKSNALFSIVVTLSGIDILVILLQPLNAATPIVVTPSGRAMLCKEELEKKAYSSRVVNLLFAANVTVVTLLYENAYLSIVVTLAGIDTLVKDLLYSNALEPIAVTGNPLYVAGIIRSVSLQYPIPTTV